MDSAKRTSGLKIEARPKPFAFASPIGTTLFSNIHTSKRCLQSSNQIVFPNHSKRRIATQTPSTPTPALISSTSTPTLDSVTPSMELNVGDRVRVLGSDIMMYHFPKFMNKPVAVGGMKGTIIKNVAVHKDVKVSATAPYIVKLDDFPKSRAHFAEDEIELITDEESESESEQ